ncbi:acyltransferase family protein [Mycobacterium kansasii 732]|nr:acyltransferase family protein [Mycobacterium kansasii 732]
MGSRAAGFYRHDLDGLRGVAIALVAAFHVWFGRVSGGVDVFLALSGFFFGGKVLRAALDPGAKLSPVTEVVRLIRRLLPALVVVLAGCALLTVLVQPQTRWETFADQSLASLGYYQNWELANSQSDYLRAGEAVSPLQHIWSMSVQGQFYVAFLFLVAACAYVFRRPLAPACERCSSCCSARSRSRRSATRSPRTRPTRPTRITTASRGRGSCS